MVRRPGTNPWLLLASLLVACGGGASTGAEPKSPTPPAPTEGSASPTLVPNMPEAKRELDEGIAAFQAAGKDCVMLCKALASMTRAADRICALTASSADSSDKQKCDDARAKVSDATQTVKSTCGGCPGP